MYLSVYYTNVASLLHCSIYLIMEIIPVNLCYYRNKVLNPDPRKGGATFLYLARFLVAQSDWLMWHNLMTVVAITSVSGSLLKYNLTWTGLPYQTT